MGRVFTSPTMFDSLPWAGVLPGLSDLGAQIHGGRYPRLRFHFVFGPVQLGQQALRAAVESDVTRQEHGDPAVLRMGVEVVDDDVRPVLRQDVLPAGVDGLQHASGADQQVRLPDLLRRADGHVAGPHAYPDEQHAPPFYRGQSGPLVWDAEPLLEHGDHISVRVSRVVRLPDQDDSDPGPACGADLLLVAADGPGVLGDKVSGADLSQGGVVDVLAERSLGADEVPALEAQFRGPLHGIHGGEDPGHDPVPVIGDGRVPVQLLGAGCREDDAFPVLQILDCVRDRVDRHDVRIRGHVRVLPSQSDVLGSGLLAAFAYVLRHCRGVRVGGVDDDLVHVLGDHPGDALGSAAASDLHVDVVVRLHYLRAVVGRHPDVDHDALGRQPSGQRPSLCGA